jgi:hypothetical protein
MSKVHGRARLVAAPLLVGLLGLVAAACAPTPPPYTGIIFNAPSIGYVGKQFTPTATSTSGLPVTLTLDATSTGCSFTGGVVRFTAPGTCVINANQPGNGTVPADPQVQRKITVHTCPVLRSGRWTGPMNLSADVVATGSSFTGTVDLTSLGFGVQLFAGTVNCEVAAMTFNGVPLTGTLSPDGNTLSSSYQGISIVLNAPAG